MKTRRALLRGAACLCALNAAAGAAQTLAPTIKILVGYLPGAATDIMARIVAERLGAVLGTSVVVENIPGASGGIALNRAISGPSNGSVILLANVNDALADVHAGTHKVDQQLSMLGGIATLPFVLVGRPSLRASGLDELLREGRESGRQFTVGASGTGTFTHLAAELLRRDLGLSMTYVPYKGASNIMTDLLGGHLDLAMVGLPSVIPHLRAETLRVYGIFSDQRSPLAPEVPALTEAAAARSMKPFAGSWVGLAVSAATATELQQRLSAALARVVASEEVQQQIRQAGAVPLTAGPADLQRIIHNDRAAFAALVREANIKAE